MDGQKTAGKVGPAPECLLGRSTALGSHSLNLAAVRSDMAKTKRFMNTAWLSRALAVRSPAVWIRAITTKKDENGNQQQEVAKTEEKPCFNQSVF